MGGEILGLIGYHANAIQTAETFAGLRLVMIAFPVVFTVIGGTAVIFDPINHRVQARIVPALKRRGSTPAVQAPPLFP